MYEVDDNTSVSVDRIEHISKQLEDSIIITAVACHENGKDIFCGKDGGSVYLYDANSGQQNSLLFKHSNKFSVHILRFESKAETLISADISGRVILHRYDRSQNTTKCILDWKAGNSIQQVLGNAGGTRIFVSSTTGRTLWTTSGDCKVLTPTKQIVWDCHESFKWANDPSNPEQLFLIVGRSLHLYTWSTLDRLTNLEGIWLDADMP